MTRQFGNLEKIDDLQIRLFITKCLIKNFW